MSRIKDAVKAAWEEARKVTGYPGRFGKDAPYHPNCRSVMLPKIMSLQEFVNRFGATIPRQPATRNYEISEQWPMKVEYKVALLIPVFMRDSNAWIRFGRYTRWRVYRKDLKRYRTCWSAPGWNRSSQEGLPFTNDKANYWASRPAGKDL